MQEYGVSNPDLLAGLAERGAQVTSVPVYEWALPEDTGPLRSAIAAIARNEIDVILFTTATQANHLLQIAAEMNQEDAVRRALSRMLVASIGPTTSERLREFGIAAGHGTHAPEDGISGERNGATQRRNSARKANGTDSLGAAPL